MTSATEKGAVDAAVGPSEWRPGGAATIGIAVSVGLFCFVGLAQIFLSGGLLAWLADHKDLAPWFSGTATSTGVIVALWNASRQRRDGLDKEDRESDRQAKSSARAQQALVESALGTIALAGHNASFIRDVLDSEDFEARLDSEVMRTGLDLAQVAFTRFPIHTIGDADAVKAYFAAEFAHNMLAEVSGLRRRGLSTGIEDDRYGARVAVEGFELAVQRFRAAVEVASRGAT